MSFDILHYPNPEDHNGIGRYLEGIEKPHRALFQSAALSPLSGFDYGALVGLTLGAATDTTGAVAKNTFTLQAVDRFGNSIAKVFRGWVIVESCDEYAGNLSLPVYYKLTETGVGAEIDTRYANGAPIGHKGKPRLYFATDANGAATITVSRVRADGSTAAVTNGGNPADVRLFVKLDIQVEAVARLQGRRCTSFT